MAAFHRVRAFAALGIVAVSACENEGGATVVVHPDSTYQTIIGWEANTQSGETEVPAFPLYADRVFDLAVDSLGITRLRMEAYSGIENWRNYWAQWRAGAFADTTWRCLRYATENDNDDPRVIDWSRFHFAQLDRKVEQVVLPIKRRLEARGERLYLNVNYVAFAWQCPNTPYHHLNADEYAEFALAVHLHLRDKYGLVPDGWEMLLEPDHTQWTGRMIGEAMVRTARILAEHGFHPDFIAPSNTSMRNAVRYFDEMIEVPGVLDLIDELSYHRYWLPTTDQLEAIAARATRHGLRTAMLEHIGSGQEDLHEDLVVGQVSSWQQYSLAYGGSGDDEDRGGVYFPVDVRTDPQRPQVRWGARTRFLRQYFRYIRPGAVRLGATTSAHGFEPTAFRNVNGTTVVVVNAARPGEVKVVALPPGTYGISAATADSTVEVKPVSVSDGDTLRAIIPAPGVLTVHGLGDRAPS